MRIGIDARCLETSKRAGVARVLKNILAEWGKLKVDHEIILYFRSYVPDDIFFNNYQIKLLDPYNLYESAVIEQVMLPKAAKRDNISILYSPEYTAPIWSSVKKAMVLHDISYSTHPEWYGFSERVRLNAFSRLAAMNAAAVFTVSDYSKSEIVRTYHLAPDKVFPIPNAAEGKFKPLSDNETALRVRAKYGLDSPYVLYIGSIFNRRKVPMLIKAFSTIADKVPHNLFIVGRNLTHPFEDIDALAKETGILDRYIRADFVDEDDLVPLYSIADAFIYVSSYEGFGIPLIEAMSCGTAVIASNVTSIPEVVGDAGIMIDPDGEHALADALNKLLTDETLRKTFEQRGLARAKQFSWGRTAKETLEVLERVAVGS